MASPPIVVGVTGASGAVLAQRCIQALLDRGREVAVVCTAAGAVVWQQELDSTFKHWVQKTPCKTFSITDIAAPIASGTFPTGGMVIVPCSMNTLAAIAHGLSGNLLERAADVTLKERRRLVLVPRETPLSAIHLRNMLTVADLGVTVIPPVPHFYARPQRVDEVVDHIVSRVLVAVGVDETMPPDQQYAP